MSSPKNRLKRRVVAGEPRRTGRCREARTGPTGVPMKSTPGESGTRNCLMASISGAGKSSAGVGVEGRCSAGRVVDRRSNRGIGDVGGSSPRRRTKAGLPGNSPGGSCNEMFSKFSILY